MGVTTDKYIRKPLYVDAVRVTEGNFEEIATWCQGEILTDDSTSRRYVKVRVHEPKFPRQAHAFVGDWILYTDKGYKVYTNRAFRLAFDPVAAVTDNTVVPQVHGNGVEATLERPPVVPAEPIETVPATPQAIADVVNEQQPVPSNSDSAPPPQTESGQRILTIAEQREMDPEEVKGLLQSGEVVLAQDLV